MNSTPTPSILVGITDVLKAELLTKAIEQKKFQLYFASKNSKEILHILREQKIEFALLDTGLTQLVISEVLYQIKKYQLPTKVILLASHFDHLLLQKFWEGDAVGFLTKASGMAEFEECLQMALNNKRYISKHINEYINETNERDKDEVFIKSKLSNREWSVMQQLAKGLTDKQVMESLFMSLSTLKTHKRHIADKLHIKGHFKLSHYAMLVCGSLR